MDNLLSAVKQHLEELESFESCAPLDRSSFASYPVKLHYYKYNVYLMKK